MENFQEEYKISQLISKEVLDELTLEESAIIQEWVGRSQENKKLYDAIKNGKRRLARDKYVGGLDTEGALEKFRTKIVPPKRTVKMWPGWIGRVAAVLIIAFLSGGVYFLSRNTIKPTQQVAQTSLNPGSSKAVLLLDGGEVFQLESTESDSIRESDGTLITNKEGKLAYTGVRNKGLETIYNTVKVPRGGEYSITLSDGTRVWLNSESQIKYPVQFEDDKRKVWVNGEVYFDVQPDKKRPFMAMVKDVEIEVLGTEFNVEAYPETDRVLTTLVEGSVKLTKASEEIIIAPNQQAVIRKSEKRFTVKNVDARVWALWKDGVIYCESERLEVIMSKLARWYDANLFYMNPSVKNKRFSIEVKRYQNIDKVLDILAATNKVRFEVHENNITIME
ncbi:FecR family protein [Plebeiibacterium marinum]|uniref:FecR domain-containing protein n=1 Tax=Plebeiibacterium marinum TaxID=2992111 RepID=A0AAE3MB89_9BACT|nr:FecR domain-containing protein [Plebeiobacterium marinum]MCW3804538.1 FecR domain-containing protein [Plebeiobacterium marinum]